MRREVAEEAHIKVAAVIPVGSQPWPIGRSPCCELMIGCLAKACSSEIVVDAVEMEDVQWYSKAAVAAAVALYGGGASIQEAQQRSLKQLGFFVPPPFAIAHHLIKMWAEATSPLFPAQKM